MAPLLPGSVALSGSRNLFEPVTSCRNTGSNNIYLLELFRGLIEILFVEIPSWGHFFTLLCICYQIIVSSFASFSELGLSKTMEQNICAQNLIKFWFQKLSFSLVASSFLLQLGPGSVFTLLEFTFTYSSAGRAPIF